MKSSNSTTQSYNFSIGKLQDCINVKENCLKTMSLPQRFNIYLIEQGEGAYMIDFEEYKLKNTSILLIAPGQIHQFNAKNIKGYFLSFDLDFYHTIKAHFKLYDFPFFHINSSLPGLDLSHDFDLIKTLFLQMHQEYETNNQFGKWSILRYQLELLLIQLTRIKQNLSEGEGNLLTPNNERLRKLEALVEKHFKEEKEVTFYANALHITPRHLNNIIHELTGKSISQIIYERLLIESKRMLLNTEYTVGEIAYDLGFNDKAYFHRFFKKHTNFTPLGFRENFLKVHQ